MLGALSWAAGSLYSRGASLPHRPLVSAGLASLCGGALLLLASLATGEPGDARLSQDALLALGYLIVAGSFVGFTTYVWLLRVAPISLVGTYAYVNPIVAVFLGWALLGEEVTVQMAAAGAAIVLSVALIVRASGSAVEPGRGLLRRRRPSPGRGARLLAADVGHLDLAQRGRVLGAELRVAVRAALPHRADRGLELVVALFGAELRAQVVTADGEEARVQLPVGREPRPRAVAAERLRHRGDDADLARAVEVPIALRHLPAVGGSTGSSGNSAPMVRRSLRRARRRRAASRSSRRRPTR